LVRWWDTRLSENKCAGRNPVCVCPTPSGKKRTSGLSRLSPEDSERENQIHEAAGSSGSGRAKRKAYPLQLDHIDDKKEQDFFIHL
uniref:PCNA-associated factor n=1 Tax=Marmota marmota marmota TaxID=9994 RepID=A0A8C5YR32_MARMA